MDHNDVRDDDDDQNGPDLPIERAGLYTTGEDHLRIRCLNSVTNAVVGVRGRFLARGARDVQILARDFGPDADRSPGGNTLHLGDGLLTDLTAMILSGAVQHGQLWVGVEVGRGTGLGGQTLAFLMEGYVTSEHRLSWPGGSHEAPLGGPGALRSIAGSAPAAGANISETVPTGARWRVLACRFTLVTSATVANRVVGIDLDDGTTSFYSMAARNLQAASQTFTYTVGTGFAYDISAPDNRFGIPIPDGVELGAGYRFRTTVFNIQAGDQLSAPQLLVREWMQQ
jgi:hypothetical protein